MNVALERITRLINGRDSGIYAQYEASGQILDILAETSSHEVPWTALPDWAKADVQEFLGKLDNTRFLKRLQKNIGLQGVSNLLWLKTWLARL